MLLVAPAMEFLESYRASLMRGWSSETATEDEAAAAAELAEIDADPAAFVAALNDPLRGGRPVTLPDGSEVPRLPGFRRWMWDGEYAGAISARWQPGTMDLPPYCLGPRRLRGRAVEAPPRLRDVGARPDAGAGA